MQNIPAKTWHSCAGWNRGVSDVALQRDTVCTARLLTTVELKDCTQIIRGKGAFKSDDTILNPSCFAFFFVINEWSCTNWELGYILRYSMDGDVVFSKSRAKLSRVTQFQNSKCNIWSPSPPQSSLHNRRYCVFKRILSGKERRTAWYWWPHTHLDKQVYC